jgi:hypothetical protein
VNFRKWRFVFGCLVLATPPAIAQTSTLTSVSGLVALVNSDFATNSWASFFGFPPGGAMAIDAGVQPFTSNFESNFLTSLVCETNLGIRFYPVTVVETNEPRVRWFVNSNGAVVYTSAVSGASADGWIEALYGAPPSWLSESESAQWRADRDRSRYRFRFNLLGTGDVAAWNTALSNALAAILSTNPPPGYSTWDGSNVWICGLFPATGIAAELYARIPIGVSRVDLFRSVAVTGPGGGWAGPSSYGFIRDPLRIVDTATDQVVKAYGLSELTDTDGDGLMDAYESIFYATNPNDADSDDDGLTDGEEVLVYETDPLNPDTDGDGLSDSWEVTSDMFYGINPTSADSDGDGLSDYAEIYKTVRGAYSNPLNADSDGDGILDGCDAFPLSPYDDQDGDGIPDEEDSDADNDGIANGDDDAPLGVDADCDGIPETGATPPLQIIIVEPGDGPLT